MGIFGNALASSALGAFKKKQSQPAAKPAAAATPAPAGPVVLMSMTTQKANFSHEAAPASAFQIPAGYKLVQSPNGF
jgi:hypothetical protein